MSALLANTLKKIRTLSTTDPGVGDAELLRRFLDQSDEAAFEALVRRHGPLVRSVCRRMLNASADADDAFQATFLVLVRRAASIRNPDALGPWLYGVALRVARKTSQQTARRKRLESSEVAAPPKDNAGDMTLNELSGILDQEIGSLPEKYRTPLILCCLQGKSRDEAARELGWSFGAVKGRLERAREMLRANLSRRGVHLSLAMFALLVPSASASALPETLLLSTVEGMRGLVGGSLVSPASVIAKLVLAEMTVSRLRSWGAGLFMVFVGVFSMAASWNAPMSEQPSLALNSPPTLQPLIVPVSEPLARAKPDNPPETVTLKPGLQRTPPPKKGPSRGVSLLYSVHRPGSTSTVLTVFDRNGVRQTRKTTRDR